MSTSKLMRIVLRSTSHEAAFPDQELNRSIENRSLCIRSLYASEQGPGRPGPREDSHFDGSANGSDFWPCRVGDRVGRADVDGIGPGEDLLGPGLLGLQDRHV